MKLIAGQYLIASNDSLPNGRFTNENDDTQQRGLNKMTADVRKLDKMKFDVHTTKTRARRTVPTIFTTKALAAGHHKMKINVSVPQHKLKKHKNLRNLVALRTRLMKRNR
jgi:hypothetical protein